MIRTLNDIDAEKLRRICEDDVFLTRIISIYDAYRNTNICETWVQMDGDNLCAVLGKLDNAITAAYFRDGNYDELEGFLYAINANRMVCSEEFARKFTYPIESSGPVLMYENLIKPECNFTFTVNPSLREIYEVMLPCKSETFTVPPWEPFYMDMSHRIRHGYATAIGVSNSEGKLCACGFTTAQTADTALISGVCTMPLLRGKGFGTNVMKAMMKELSQHQIFVMRDKNENEAFYTKLGFFECGSWAECRI